MHALCAALALILLAQPGATTDAQQEAASLARRTFDAVNQHRIQAGHPPLKWDDDLAAAAREHALNMAGRGFFAHEDPVLGGLAERLGRRGIGWRTCAENIFTETGFRNPAEKAVEGWMASPGHRQNILDPRLTHSGIGVASTGDGTRYFVQIFTIPGPVRDARGLVNRGRRSGKTTSSSR